MLDIDSDILKKVIERDKIPIEGNFRTYYFPFDLKEKDLTKRISFRVFTKNSKFTVYYQLK